MAKSTELKPVTRYSCDFCGDELYQVPIHICAVCKRDMCTRGDSNGEGHTAYTILLSELRKSPKDEHVKRSHLFVCKECAKETLNLPLGELFEGMMNKEYSLEKFKVRKGC